MHTYKVEHEQFVTGHNGTTNQEIVAVISVTTASCLARNILILAFGSKLAAQTIKTRLFTDILLLVLPFVLAVTVLSNQSAFLLGSILFVSSFVVIQQFQPKSNLPTFGSALRKTNLADRKLFVTYFRSLMNMCTAVAILAVDFPAFPRRFAKAEIYGMGLMDTGVGFFVVANAVVAPEARGKQSTASKTSHMKKAVSSSLPLLVLGFGRLISVKSTDYQEHVTEYGVHWNFFFTLAALRILVSLLFCMIRPKHCAMIGIVVLLLHQTCLSSGLSHYIVNGQDGRGGRVGLLDANREGICSLPGYIAIYLMGVSLGKFVFQRRHCLMDWLEASAWLVTWVTVTTMGMFALHSHVELVSRRFANAAFVLWIMSLSSVVLLECLLVDIVTACLCSVKDKNTHESTEAPRNQNYKELEIERINSSLFKSEVQDQLSRATKSGSGERLVSSHSRPTESPDDSVRCRRDLRQQAMPPTFRTSLCVLEAIGCNALLYFLLANVLTGIVNMSMRTIHASTTVAVVTLMIYCSVLSTVMLLLQQYNISTKFW